MGLITLFTCGDRDLNSLRVKQELSKRDLPFTEVDCIQHPDKIYKIRRLASSSSLPQVFFNTRNVGGVSALKRELVKAWDRDSAYASPRERFDALIERAGDPKQVMEIIPDSSLYRKSKEEDFLLYSSSSDSDEDIIREVRKSSLMQPLSIYLPDGTRCSTVDITEKLKNTLARAETPHRGTIYKNSLPGISAAATFRKSMDLDQNEARSFGQQLVDSKVLHHVGGSKSFKDKQKAVYRLQCYMNPDVLNSYAVWTDNVEKSNLDLLDHLDEMLGDIEYSAYNHGRVDIVKALGDPKFPQFEEAICELQQIKLGNMTEPEKMAFGINLYKLMQRYAFIKVGVPVKESDRLHMFTHLKFNVGGALYSFKEWFDGILRANRKATYNRRVPFGQLDGRREHSLKQFDHRVHFAIHLDSRFGSRASVPFSRYTPNDLDNQLELAARVFCNDSQYVSFSTKSNELKLYSAVFGLYRSDFCKKESDFPKFLCHYLEHNRKILMAKHMSAIKKVVYESSTPVAHLKRYLSFDRQAIVGDAKGLEKIVKRFLIAKPPENEELRLATLHSLNILDTLPEERFDRITAMVKEEFNVPLVFVTCIDAERQWMKSKQWACDIPAMDECPRAITFCSHTIRNGDGEAFVVENALEDDRFADNPIVAGDFHVRFYAGCNISIPSVGGSESINIGALCIHDFEPRKFGEEDIKKLSRYTAMVKEEILRRDQSESLCC